MAPPVRQFYKICLDLQLSVEAVEMKWRMMLCKWALISSAQWLETCSFLKERWIWTRLKSDFLVSIWNCPSLLHEQKLSGLSLLPEKQDTSRSFFCKQVLVRIRMFAYSEHGCEFSAHCFAHTYFAVRP